MYINIKEGESVEMTFDYSNGKEYPGKFGPVMTYGVNGGERFSVGIKSPLVSALKELGDLKGKTVMVGKIKYGQGTAFTLNGDVCSKEKTATTVNDDVWAVVNELRDKVARLEEHTGLTNIPF
jgi:hypothetical protein